MSIWRGQVWVWCLLLVLAMPAAAGAQGFKWWQSDKFKADLALSPEQIVRLEEVYQGLRPKLTAGKEELDRLESGLSTLIAEGVAPEGDVMKMVDQVEHSRAELAKSRTLMIYRMHQILTVDQRAKMNALHERWEQERRSIRRQPAK
jgi:Spy/CpxP family protein refolding chaperone